MAKKRAKNRRKICNRKAGYYSISAVAQMLSIHQQTIRMYEREGLISPKRSAGNTRMFTEEDIERLEEIIYLTQQVGVNLAGVELILKLQRKITRLQKEVESLFGKLQNELQEAQQEYSSAASGATKTLRELAQRNAASAKKALPPAEKSESGVDGRSETEEERNAADCAEEDPDGTYV